MKNYLTTLILFIITGRFCFGNSIEIEMLGTDFNGIFHSGSTIIIYGKYGNITYSNDLGVSWKQSIVGYTNDILKIISLEGKFYALSPENIFVSDDQGKTWQPANIQWENNFVDFCTDGNEIIIITENEILSVDKELKNGLKVNYKFDPFIKFTEMAILGKYVFIIDAKKVILKFNISTNAPEDTIYTGYPDQDIERLKIKDSTLYVLLVSNEVAPSIIFNYQLIRHSILCSKDLKTWELFAKSIPITKDYLIEGGEAQTLSPKLLTKNIGFTVVFVKSDKNGLIEENEIAEPNVWIPFFNFIENANIFQINAITRVNDSILVACGNNKTILISKNNGKNWKYISYFRPIHRLINLFSKPNINNIVQRGEDTIAILSFYPPYVFVSFDGGVTFKTLGIDTNLSNILNVKTTCPITHRNGQLGYFTFQLGNNRKINGSINITKFDLENIKYKVDTFILKSYEFIKWDSVNFITFFDPIFYKENIIIIANLFQTLNPPLSSLAGSLIFVLDKDLRLIDTLFLPKEALLPVSNDENYLYTFFIDTSKINVLRTTSLRNPWEIVVSLPQVSYKKPNEEVNIRFEKVVNNYYLFVKTVITNNSEYKYYILFLDKRNGNLDSILLPSSPEIFTIGDTILVSSDIWLYEITGSAFDTLSFIKYSLPEIDVWSLNSLFRLGNKNFISFYRKYISAYDFFYEGNYGLIFRKHNAPNIVVEKNKPFLFCFPPYPNPAKNYVDLPISWDSGYSIDNIKFSCLNVSGQNLPVPINFFQASLNRGTLRFFLNDFPPGVYFIYVKLLNNEWLVPFVLTK